MKTINKVFSKTFDVLVKASAVTLSISLWVVWIVLAVKLVTDPPIDEALMHPTLAFIAFIWVDIVVSIFLGVITMMFLSVFEK